MTTATNAAISGVSAGSHLFQVQALGQGVNGIWGPPAFFAFLVISPPSAPNSLVCNHATNGMPTTFSSLVFSWQPSVSGVGLTGYSYSLDQMPVNLVNTASTNAAISNLAVGSHVFHVMAQDINGVWGPTADFQFVVWAPGTEPPGAPPGLTCSSSNNGMTYLTNNIFTWQVPLSENGVAGYSYALNGLPVNTVNTSSTTVTIASMGFGRYIFQVKAEGSNGVWGATSSFQLLVQPLPPPVTPGPLPPWSLAVLTFGVFAAGVWLIRRQKSGGYGH